MNDLGSDSGGYFSALLMTLFLVTLSIGAAVTLLARALTGLWLTPALWYYGGWTLGSAGIWYSSWRKDLPPVTANAYELMLQLHVGAAVGIVAASIVYSAALVGIHRPRNYQSRSVSGIPDGVFWSVVIVLSLLGSLALYLRLQGVVAQGSLSLLEVRNSYLATRHTGLINLITHLQIAFSVIPVAIGWRDGRAGRIDRKQIGWLWLAGVPAGLSTGGRGWILGPFPVYFAAFLIAQDGPAVFRATQRLVLRALPVVVFTIALFSAMAAARQGGWRVREAEGPETTAVRLFDPLLPVADYFGAPLSAAGPFAEFAAAGPPRRGLLLFPWFSSQFARMSLIPLDIYAAFVEESRDHVRATTNSVIASSHATIIPNIVGDFGTESVFAVGVILLFVVQTAALIGRRMGLFGRYVAVYASLYGGLWLFQDSMFASSAVVLGVGWTVIFASLLPNSRPSQPRAVRFSGQKSAERRSRENARRSAAAGVEL